MECLGLEVTKRSDMNGEGEEKCEAQIDQKKREVKRARLCPTPLGQQRVLLQFLGESPKGVGMYIERERELVARS